MALGLAATLAVSPVTAPAQTYAFNSVVVEGNSRIETGTILTYAGVTRGEPISAGALNDAAQSIRATGLFQSVDLIPQGGTLVIRVSEYPTIARINFEGNNRLDDGDLGRLVQSVPRRVFSPATAEADADRIAEAYAAQGRINALVEPVIIQRPGNTVDLVFEVSEGGVSEVERISFIGNRAFSERRLRGVLETKQAGALRLIIQRDTYLRERLDFDRSVLQDFYQSRGYIDMIVQDVDVSLTRERDAYIITFAIQEGLPWRLGQATVSSEIAGVDLAPYAAELRFASGALYSPDYIDRNVDRLERLATRQGLNFVRVDPRITRNERGQILDVNFTLVRGERIFVERIDIEGNNTTLDRVIRSRFRTVEGDPLNPREIRESAERIRALGYFGNVDVETRPGSSPDQVVVDVDVDEVPTGSLTFGGNYNSDNGLSFVASFTEENFLGRGQSVDFQLQTGSRSRTFVFDFTEPNFLNRDLAFGLETAYRTTDNANALYDTETFRFSPSFRFPVSENGRLTAYYALDYADITDVTGERTDPPADRASLLIFDEADEGGIWTQSVGYNYSWDSRRSGIESDTAFILRFGQEFGVGDASFIRTTGEASFETTILRGDVTLRGTLEGGMLDYQEGASRVTDRFFLGSRVMRGFEPGGIGPRDDATDDALGGNKYAVARLEAQFPLGLPEEYGITGGVFVDYGSVWDVGDFRSLSEDDVIYNDYTPRAVAGVSIFWTTPLGPLRFNFSEPLQAEERDQPRSFDLTVSSRF